MYSDEEIEEILQEEKERKMENELNTITNENSNINDDEIKKTKKVSDSFLQELQEEAKKESNEKLEKLKIELQEEQKYVSKFNGLQVTSGLGEHSPFKELTEKGILNVEFKENNKGKMEPIMKSFFGKIIIKNAEIITDPLELNEDVYNLEYYNLTNNKHINLKYKTMQEITNHFTNSNCFYSAVNKINSFFKLFLMCAKEKELLTVKEEAYLKGFWLINDKVVSNTEIDNIEYSKEDLTEAITLLNEMMSSRSEEGKQNDSTVYRFMLYCPFSYIMKQIGLGESNKGLILIGASQTNKSGSIKIANHFYKNTGEETAGSTVSVLGSKLEENSFPAVFDECSHLFKLPEALNVMKRAIYEKTARATKDRNDNKKIDEFKALGMPVFILNEWQNFKDYIQNRYKIIGYTKNSFVKPYEKEEFNKKYLPTSPYTELKKLNIIGKAFSKKMIKLLEDPKQHRNLSNLEETTIKILKELANEANTDFINEMYIITDSTDLYNYNIEEKVRKLLNEEFKNKNRLPAGTGNIYSSDDVRNSIIKNDFPFIIYNRFKSVIDAEFNKDYYIKSAEFKKYINESLEEQVELEQILEALGLTERLKNRASYESKEHNKEYSKFINKTNLVKIKDNDVKSDEATYKSVSIRGFYISSTELTKNFFGLDLDETE